MATRCLARQFLGVSGTGVRLCTSQHSLGLVQAHPAAGLASAGEMWMG